jgi:hypothetical protein
MIWQSDGFQFPGIMTAIKFKWMDGWMDGWSLDEMIGKADGFDFGNFFFHFFIWQVLVEQIVVVASGSLCGLKCRHKNG